MHGASFLLWLAKNTSNHQSMANDIFFLNMIFYTYTMFLTKALVYGGLNNSFSLRIGMKLL